LGLYGTELKARVQSTMQLMCHYEAYTDQALAVGRPSFVHHNGSPHRRRALIWCILDFLGPNEQIRCIVQPAGLKYAPRTGVAILADFALAASI
jgi:hypothetical protein